MLKRSNFPSAFGNSITVDDFCKYPPLFGELARAFFRTEISRL